MGGGRSGPPVVLRDLGADEWELTFDTQAALRRDRLSMLLPSNRGGRGGVVAEYPLRSIG
jgi:hypothetical protein